MIKFALAVLAALCLATPLRAQAPASAPSPAAGTMQSSDTPSKVTPPRAGDDAAGDPKQLPATASDVPELAFLGFASLGAALALRSAARRRA